MNSKYRVDVVFTVAGKDSGSFYVTANSEEEARAEIWNQYVVPIHNVPNDFKVECEIINITKD